MIETFIVSPGHALPVEARLTQPDDPGWGDRSGLTYGHWFLGYGEDWREGMGDHRQALTYSVVWGCVTYIAQTISALGWHTFERQQDGRSRMPVEDDVSWMLGVQANPEMDAFNWRRVMLKDALLWGNGYAEIDRDGFGRPHWLWRLDPARVEPEIDDDGRLYYRVTNYQPGGADTFLDPRNVFHLKGLGADGVVGYSAIEMFRRTFELGIQEERFGQQFFRRGPLPGGVVEIPGKMTKQAREEYRDGFERVYGGSKNAGRVIVVDNGAKFNTMTMSNDDAKFIESRTFQAEEVARIFRVPPHKVGLLSRSTYSNIESQAIEAVQDCLLPWCRALESEADVKLYGRINRGRRFTRLNLGTLLRGDSRTQTETVTSQVNHGLRTINEGREFFDLNPLEDGDTPLVQGAMVPLERVLEEPPAPAPAPAARPAPAPAPDEDDEEMAAGLREVFGELLAKVYSRLLGVEGDKARRAANKGTLARHTAVFYAGHREEAQRDVLPVIAGLLLALGKPADGSVALAARLAEDHCAESVRDLENGRAAGWGERAAKQAQRHLDMVWESLKAPTNGVHA